MSKPVIPITLAITERATTHRSKRIACEYRTRSYSEINGADELILPLTVRTKRTKRPRLISFLIFMTANH